MFLEACNVYGGILGFWTHAIFLEACSSNRIHAIFLEAYLASKRHAPILGA